MHEDEQMKSLLSIFFSLRNDDVFDKADMGLMWKINRINTGYKNEIEEVANIYEALRMRFMAFTLLTAFVPIQDTSKMKANLQPLLPRYITAASV